MTDPDIWQLAKNLISEYGDGALSEALLRAYRFQLRDDQANFELWMKVVGAIEASQGESPSRRAS